MRVANAELGCVQDNQNLGCKCLDRRLARFTANQVGNLVAPLVEEPLKPPQHCDSLPHRSCLPRRLGLLCAQDGALDIAGAGACQLGQHFSSRGLGADDGTVSDHPCFSCHWSKSLSLITGWSTPSGVQKIWWLRLRFSA